MKVTDYIMEFLAERGIGDIFGYPGGHITHFVDSASKHSSIMPHLAYHEQGAAFAACGYGQAGGRPGTAFSTSGPGATNLVTGIADAFYDSIPAVFFTGQAGTYSSKGAFPIRQRGFQETDIVSMTKSVAKYAEYVARPDRIKFCLEKAYYLAGEGNPGSCVLDLPSDVQRAEINPKQLEGYTCPEKKQKSGAGIENIIQALRKAKRPVILAGNGCRRARDSFRELAEKIGAPVTASLPAFDMLTASHPLNFGFIGTNGSRAANILLAKCDLILVLGSRMDLRQIGLERGKFAPQAGIIRVDADENQFFYPVRGDEHNICADLSEFMPELSAKLDRYDFSPWLEVCREIKKALAEVDRKEYHQEISEFSSKVPDDAVITIDVGQNQLWVAQAFEVKGRQSAYMSAGHGAMGYALPAAAGVYYASGKPVYAFCGDGGFMMNLQELQWLKRDKIPVSIVCLNNHSLGMIRSWQQMHMNGNCRMTVEESGYLAPDLKKIARAFDMQYSCLSGLEDIQKLKLNPHVPALFEMVLKPDTMTVPNFDKDTALYDQKPHISRRKLDYLMNL